jgi:GNAT superfamily N-acetyltransferase
MAVELRFYSSENLPPDLKWQILSFLRVTWPDGFVGENRLRDWISPPEDHPSHAVLVENGLLISHTEVVWRYLDHAGETYKAYGLSGVFTYPSLRRQGYGRQVVDAGTEIIRASDADIGIFHCAPNLGAFYAASGWIPMAGVTSWVGPKSVPVVSDELMMMLFLSDRGQRGRPAFEREPLYFGEYTW